MARSSLRARGQHELTRPAPRARAQMSGWLKHPSVSVAVMGILINTSGACCAVGRGGGAGSYASPHSRSHTLTHSHSRAHTHPHPPRRCLHGHHRLCHGRLGARGQLPGRGAAPHRAPRHAHRAGLLPRRHAGARAAAAVCALCAVPSPPLSSPDAGGCQTLNASHQSTSSPPTPPRAGGRRSHPHLPQQLGLALCRLARRHRTHRDPGADIPSLHAGALQAQRCARPMRRALAALLAHPPPHPTPPPRACRATSPTPACRACCAARGGRAWAPSQTCCPTGAQQGRWGACGCPGLLAAAGSAGDCTPPPHTPHAQVLWHPARRLPGF